MENRLNKLQANAFKAIEDTNSNFLIQGPPGTGKSVLINYLVAEGRKTYTLGAPTGLAALNIGGKTIHSLFGIPVSDGVITPDNNNFTQFERVINNVRYNLKHLIIDEVSMVRVDQFDFIDRFLKQVKGNQQPFGGVQVIIVGDFFQLPPVVKGVEEKKNIKELWGSPFVFSAKAFSGFEVIELTEVMRQKGDPKFIKLLNHARTGDLNKTEVATLNKCVGEKDDMRIKLVGTNQQAETVNLQHLEDLPGKTIEHHANATGDWPAFPVETIVQLRVGSQVMVKQNGADYRPGDKKKNESTVVNGTIGKVVEIQPSHVTVTTEKGQTFPVYRQRWERKVKEKVGSDWTEKTTASFEQIPLTLSWAISMHKSQGQTFEKAHIDGSKIFEAGQMYVALSRIRSLKGLSLESPIKAYKFYPNKDVMKFFNL